MYQKAKTRWFKHFDFMLLDLVMIEAAFLLAEFLRVYNSYRIITPSILLYHQLRIIVVVIDLFIGMVIPLHHDVLKRKPLQEFTECVKNTLLVIIFLILYLYFVQKAFYFSRTIFVLFLITSTLFLFLERTVYKTFLKKQLAGKGKLVQTVLVTDSAHLAELLHKLMKHCENRFTLVGVVLTDYNKNNEDSYQEILAAEMVPVFCQVIGNCYDMYRQLGTVIVTDEVILDIGNVQDSEEITHFLLEMGITVHINLVRTYGELPNQMVGRVGGLTVMTTSQNMASPVMLLMKRLLDIAGSIVGLFFCAVAVIIFGPIIYRQSPGNIFFSQERIGQHGRRFRIWKLRSMYPDAEARKAKLMEQNEMQGLMFKMKDDPRIIPIGHFIRKYSIDELPQFYNILKGDMSLVGTRPPTVDEWDHYEKKDMARMSFKPGLTGMWQVSGRSDIKEFDKIVELDMKYIREWTIWLDIRILFKTVMVVLKKEGAE